MMAFDHFYRHIWIHFSNYLEYPLVCQISFCWLADIHFYEVIFSFLNDFFWGICYDTDFYIHGFNIRGFDLRNNVWYIFSTSYWRGPPQKSGKDLKIKHSSVAQLVEQLAVNELVVGSNPTRGAIDKTK